MKFTNQELLNLDAALAGIASQRIKGASIFKLVDNMQKISNKTATIYQALAKAETEEEKQEIKEISQEIDILPMNEEDFIEAMITPAQAFWIIKLFEKEVPNEL